MARFDTMKGIFGLLPTPYREDLEIHTEDLRKVANFCCESGQHGIVCTVRHEHDHRGIAHERFLPSGPFAILPLPGNISSLVWTEKDAIARRVLASTKVAA